MPYRRHGLPGDHLRCSPESNDDETHYSRPPALGGAGREINEVRRQIAEELPESVARHHGRMAALDQLQELLTQLKAAHEAKGLSLSDPTVISGMDRSALSKLEIGQRANSTIETLVRYAEAVGKRLVVALIDG